ncbi:MAG: Uncharacterized protein RPC_1322, partial [uncultured Microvirga sp.]
MTTGWGRQTVDVPCTVEIEHSFDSLHAYVDLEGIEVGPGDEVVVHDAPTEVPYGERIVVRRRATVVRAGPLGRLWAHIEGYLELTELYEVS